MTAFTMSQKDHDKLFHRLGTIEGTLKGMDRHLGGIERHLQEQNSKIAKHEKRLRIVETAAEINTGKRQKDEENHKWWKRRFFGLLLTMAVTLAFWLLITTGIITPPTS